MRKAWAWRALIVVLVATSTAPAGPALSAAQAAQISLDPTCSPPGTLVDVNGTGFPANLVGPQVRFDGAVVPVADLDLDDGGLEGAFEVPAGASGGAHVVSIWAAGSTLGPTTLVEIARAPFCAVPVIVASPACGDAGTAVTVRGSDFAPGGGVVVTFAGQPVSSLVVVGSQFTTTFTVPPTAPVGAHPIAAVPADAVEFTLPCAGSGSGSIVLDRPLGPPGAVVGVGGSGFRPGERVILSWSPGLGMTEAVAGGGGSFVARVLVFQRDLLGPRTLTATRPEVPNAPRATANFLVVPGTQQPGDFVVRR